MIDITLPELKVYLDSYFDKRLSVFATKEDLKAFATKEDLKAFATKEDIANMATKDDIAAVRQEMATKDDIAAVRQEMATKDDIAAVRQEMATKDDIARLERRMMESRTINVKHHLETRSMIGDLNRQLLDLREGLSKAGDSLHQLS